MQLHKQTRAAFFKSIFFKSTIFSSFFPPSYPVLSYELCFGHVSGTSSNTQSWSAAHHLILQLLLCCSFPFPIIHALNEWNTLASLKPQISRENYGQLPQLKHTQKRIMKENFSVLEMKAATTSRQHFVVRTCRNDNCIISLK